MGVVNLPSRTAPLVLPNPPQGGFAAYIFDCDGTLAATMGIHYEAWLHAIRRYCGKNVDWAWENFCSMGGMSIADTIAILNARYGLAITEPQAVDGTDEYLKDHLASALPCEDALALARQGAAHGVKLAVASGGHRWRVESTLRGIGAESLFPVVVTSEDVARVKPAPDLFLLAAKKLDVLPERCLVIEDSPKGRDAADAAGMACLLVEAC
jgi:beta-phosphoglucomutase-like phosphatase (HAD superfamily)